LSLDLGSVAVGFHSASQPVEVANVGDDYLEVSYEFKDVLQQFGFSEYLPPAGVHQFELYPGEKHTFYLAFHPVQVGAAESSFQLLSDDDLLPQVDVQLRAMGTPPEPRISIYYNYVNPIKDVPIGGEGSSLLLIENWGSAPLEILAVTSSNPHFTTSVSSSLILPKQSGNLTVTYHPVTWGLETTTLTITHNDPTWPTFTLSLGGQAFEPPPVAQVTPTTLDFGSLHQGTSATLSFEVRNVGAGPLRLYEYGPLLPSYCAAQTDLTLPATILPGGSLVGNVTYSADIDKSSCSISFYTNDPALSSVTVQLVATILSPRVAFSTYALQFPNTQVGSTSTMTVTVFNLGPETLVIRSATSYNSLFSVVSLFPFTVPPDGSAELQLAFTPTSVAGSSTTITFETNEPAHRQVYLYLYGFGSQASSAKPRESLR
jgi:hypothetical protein